MCHTSIYMLLKTEKLTLEVGGSNFVVLCTSYGRDFRHCDVKSKLFPVFEGFCIFFPLLDSSSKDISGLETSPRYRPLLRQPIRFDHFHQPMKSLDNFIKKYLLKSKYIQFIKSIFSSFCLYCGSWGKV